MSRMISKENVVVLCLFLCCFIFALEVNRPGEIRATSFNPTSLGCGSNVNLVFRAFAVFFGSVLHIHHSMATLRLGSGLMVSGMQLRGVPRRSHTTLQDLSP